MMDYTRSVKAAEDAWRVDAYYGSRLVERKSRRCRRAAASRSGRRSFPAEDLALRVTNTRFPTSCRRGPVDRAHNMNRRYACFHAVVASTTMTFTDRRSHGSSDIFGFFFFCPLISIFFSLPRNVYYSVVVVMSSEKHTTRHTRNSVKRILLLYLAEWKDIILCRAAHTPVVVAAAHNT